MVLYLKSEPHEVYCINIIGLYIIAHSNAVRRCFPFKQAGGYRINGSQNRQ